MKKNTSIIALMFFTFLLLSCNSMKYANATKQDSIEEPIKKSDYPDTVKEFYEIQNAVSTDMTVNRAQAQFSAKANLGARIHSIVTAIGRQQLSALRDGPNLAQTQNQFDQKALEVAKNSVAKLMLIDTKLLRDKKDVNDDGIIDDVYDYWVVYKIFLEDVADVINQSDLGISITSEDLFKTQ
jgi:hypothetical protein